MALNKQPADSQQKNKNSIRRGAVIYQTQDYKEKHGCISLWCEYSEFPSEPAIGQFQSFKISLTGPHDNKCLEKTHNTKTDFYMPWQQNFPTNEYIYDTVSNPWFDGVLHEKTLTIRGARC